LKGLEVDGSVGKIYNRWFGPQTKTPLVRIFRIGDKA
jgi:polar amino acid transport system substrate-binding protein